jgi:carbonic anhydrase
LNPLIPEVLGIPESEFIWLRAAGNIITDPDGSMMRSLALACAIKGAREVAIIGHTDCRVRQTTIMELTDRFRAMGIDRSRLPDNLAEYFGIFASEQQNVIRGAEMVRSSPLIGPKIPVHGLLVDIQSGRLEWLVNGYQTLGTPASAPAEAQPGTTRPSGMPSLPAFNLGEMKFPEGKIGDAVEQASKWLADVHVVPPAQPPQLPPLIKAEQGKPLPLPPPLRPGVRLQQPWKKRPAR